MKKAPLILTLVSLITVLLAAVLYQSYFRKEIISAWDVIPDQTVMVYEVGDCKECITDISNTVVGNLFTELFGSPQTDSTTKALQFLSFLRKGELVSIHIVNKENFDFVFYIPQNQAQDYDTVLNSWQKIKGVKKTQRILNNVKIQEFDFGIRKFSYAQMNGLWIGSFTPFLIEDVIRTSTSDSKSLFKDKISEVHKLPRVKNDIGNLYIHLPALLNFFKIFIGESPFGLINIEEASLLDIKQSEGSLVLNGFSLGEKNSKKSVLTYFENQTPVQFTLKQYISNSTAFAINFGISEGSSFYSNILAKNGADSLDGLIKFDRVKLFSTLGDELSICFQEERNEFSKTILFETSAPKEWLKIFDQLSVATEKSDTVFYEKYSSFEIREIEIANLPGKLFSPLTSGFNQTYYTSIDNTIILAENLEQIKRFIDDVDREDVWGKSVSVNKFIESTLLESNLSIYINTPIVWSAISKKLNPMWKTFISSNPQIVSGFGWGAIQFSHLNEGFYTNINWNYSSVPIKNRIPIISANKLVVNLTSSIIRGPFVVRSHVSKADEVLVQDSTNTLYFVASDGKILWSKVLDSPIVDDVEQVDFFVNGKQQFLLATQKKLHVIDRLGNYVNPFPADINTGEIEHLSVIDYDNSKKYRFMIDDKSGKIWIYDKSVQNLEGWRPKNLESNLVTQARHHRIRGKDYIIAIRRDGWAYLTNRKGENVKGFPLNLDARPDGDYYLEIGNSLSTTYFVCISKDGFRIRFNLEGKILSKETLVKPIFNTQFSLVSEEMRGKSYLIKRQDSKHLTILSEDGKEFIVNDFVGSNSVAVKYYDFGAGKVFVSITDLSQDLSFIYDGSGKLLTETPIEGETLELRPGSGENPKMFVVNSKALIIQE